jgi:copper resistance protein C
MAAAQSNFTAILQSTGEISMPPQDLANAFTKIVALILTFVIALSAAFEASAHATLVKSDPGRRATIKTAPKEIVLWFSEKLEPAYSSVSLLNGEGKLVATQPAVVSRDNTKRIVLVVDTLSPGIYRVRYRVMSVDGHIVDSSYTFTLQPAK